MLISAGSLALAASLGRLPLDLAYGAPSRQDKDPFTLGIASGDPRADGARTRITRFLHDARVRNPVVITGDWHSTFANDVEVDYEDPSSPVVAAEFVTPSVSSNGDAEVCGPYYGPKIQFNPHIRFFDGDRHGSMKARVRRGQIEVDWRIADRGGDPNAAVRTLRTFAVESGLPGVAQY